MIPRRLHLTNFLSYLGPTELDLRQVHVACLCGDNGHGKSALLDAITWALWGWARGRRFGQGGASHDELVFQGQQEMEVELEFEAAGAVYKVVRKYSRSGRARSPASILDLQVVTAGNGAALAPAAPGPDGAFQPLLLEDPPPKTFRSLTVGSVVDTERQLQSLLRMDYETFTSSAFLLQGHDDRFTTSTPARRKEILAEILGLGIYERLEERARERVREQDALIVRTQVDRERVDREMGRRAEYDEALAAAEVSLGALAPILEASAADLERLRADLLRLEERRQQVDDLRVAIARAEEEAVRLESQARAARDRTARLQEALARRVEVEEGAVRLGEARERLRAMDDAQGRYDELSQSALALEQATARQKQGLESDAAHLSQRIEGELAPRTDRLPEIERALEEVARGLAALEGQAREVRERRETLETSRREAEWLTSENARLRGEMEDLRTRFDMLVPGQTRCPLCGTVLGAEGTEHLRQETQARGVTLREQYVANEELVRRGEPERRRLEEANALGEQWLEHGRESLLAQQGSLSHELEECRRAASELAVARERRDDVAARIEREDFAHDERALLTTVRAELAALPFDPDGHREARTAVADLEGYADLARQVAEAVERLPNEEASLADLEALLDARRREVVAAGERLEAVEGGLQTLPLLQGQVEAAAREHGRLDGDRGRLEGEVHLHRARIEELERLGTEAARLHETAREQEGNRATYALLAEAFGKRGVQALLIEAALPELETEANALLARLTDGRMQLTLESQKQTRRGDVSETLEIRIADELGTRSYELFSGGEAFRINFALRIALAKLLASRSGAPLRTLFLDEGFGTQDTTGRQRLVEAIQAIQDEFDLILVITHIEELKEAFPVRIEVTKTDEGSALEVVWS